MPTPAPGAAHHHRAPAVVLVGPTASGKSTVAHCAATAVPGAEICSIDSMQVYRHMDIGTAKPTAAQRVEVPYHLIDLVEPTEEHTLAGYLVDAQEVLATIEQRGGVALGVGGTGLYVHALVDDLDVPGRYPDVRTELEAEADTTALHDRLCRLDPLAASRMERTNRRRIVRALEVTIGSGRPFSSYGPGVAAFPEVVTDLVGLRWPRDLLDRRIAVRWEAMLDAGLLAEVATLATLAEGAGGLSATARQALGYRELLDHLEGAHSLEEAVHLAVVRPRRFARRQERWFRRDPRIEWWDVHDDDQLPECADCLAARLAARLGAGNGRSPA